MLICLVFSAALLALYIYLNANGETMLEDFCNSTGIFSSADSLKNYDTIYTSLGTNGGFCHSSTCECKLPNNANYDYKYQFHSGGTETTRTLTHSGSGKMKIQDCPTLFDNYSSTAQSFINIMKPIEEKYLCGGICYSTNIMASHDTTNT